MAYYTTDLKKSVLKYESERDVWSERACHIRVEEEVEGDRELGACAAE
jgi:hypothetical protein